MTYIWASKIGCALDCDLENGRNKHHGGKATDDGPRINAAMAGASAERPITLIIDGSALISGLFLPAGGYWNIAGLGCGTGFYIKSGTNNDGIHNGPANAAQPTDPGPPAPARGKNVSLQNFTISGNRGDGHDGVSSSGDHRGSSTTWYFGINLMNLDNIRVENVVVVNTPAYHMRFSNVGNVSVAGCVMQSRGPNSDGLHFNGPANDIHIANCEFTVDDDSIALNCPEGYSGNISRVTVTGCSVNSWSLLRLYTSSGTPMFTIDTVSVSNCSGTLTEEAIVIGLNGQSLPNSVTGLTVSDCTLTAPAILGVSENFGTITLRNVAFTPSLAHIAWFEPQVNRMCAFLRPSPSAGTVSYVGGSLTLENCSVVRNSDVKAAAVILENESTLTNLSFTGFSVANSAIYAPLPELLTVGSGGIAQLVIDSLNSANIEAPVPPDGFGSLGAVSGTGVLATGWEFADVVMSDGVPYFSASTGLPSIKIAGVVELYSQA